MVMKDGQAIILSVMGGRFQPMGHSLFLSNHFRIRLDVQEAIDLTRLMPQDRQGADRTRPARPWWMS